MPEILCISTGL